MRRLERVAMQITFEATNRYRFTVEVCSVNVLILLVCTSEVAYIMTSEFFRGSKSAPREASTILCLSKNLKNHWARDQNFLLASSLLVLKVARGT